MENLYPRLQNHGWENGAFWLPRGFILACLDLGEGNGGPAVLFILSKIVVWTFNSFLFSFKVTTAQKTRDTMRNKVFVAWWHGLEYQWSDDEIMFPA